MTQVGPVVRVKLYRDANGTAKGDALVTYQKDAAVLGAGEPAICGQFYSQVWILPLTDAWRALPIVALELAGAIGNVLAFAAAVGDAPVSLVVDALVVPYALASAVRDSPVCQYMHSRLLETPEYAAIADRSCISHEYGPGNPVTDAGSRGYHDVLRDLMRALGLTMQSVPPPALLADILNGAAAVLDEQRARAERQPHVPTPPYAYGVEAIEYMAPSPLDAMGSAPAPPTPKRQRVDASPLSLLGARSPPPPLRALEPSPPPPGRTVARQLPDPLAALGGDLVAPLPGAPARAPPPSGAGGDMSAVVSALRADASPLALCPGNPERLESVMTWLTKYLTSSYADSTNRTDDGRFKQWKTACAWLGTPAWRTDIAANIGIDRIGHFREQLLPALVTILCAMWQKPRSHASPAAKPGSAYAVPESAKRRHAVVGIQMADFGLAKRVVKGMMRGYVKLHGASALVPARKSPFPCSPTSDVVVELLHAPAGFSADGLTVDYDLHECDAANVCFSVLAETGNRYGEVPAFTFASLVWKIGGAEYTEPSAEQLASMRDGVDGVWLLQPASKNDPFLMFFGSAPSFLPYDGTAPRNACRRLAEWWMRCAVPAAQRATTPLFGPRLGSAFAYDRLTKWLHLFLLAAGVPRSELHKYSIHSFRITLCCKLYGMRVPLERIKRLLRWRSDDSVQIYGRVNDPEAAEWVRLSYRAPVDSSTAAHLYRQIDVNVSHAFGELGEADVERAADELLDA